MPKKFREVMSKNPNQHGGKFTIDRDNDGIAMMRSIKEVSDTELLADMNDKTEKLLAEDEENEL